MITDEDKRFDSSSLKGNNAPTVGNGALTQITPYVFISDQNAVQQLNRLLSYGITCVINVAEELPYIPFPASSSVESLKYPIIDSFSFPALNYFDTIADRIASNAAANRRTLIYCRFGQSRSVAFTLAYLIKYHGWTLPVAYEFVRSLRPLALPNPGFWSQLHLYDRHQQRNRRRQQLYTLGASPNMPKLTLYNKQMQHKMLYERQRLRAGNQLAHRRMYPIYSGHPEYDIYSPYTIMNLA